MSLLSVLAAGLRHTPHFLWHHFAEALVPAVCVAALVALIHQTTYALDPLKALVFTNIGNTTSYEHFYNNAGSGDPFRHIAGRSATVISIGERSFAADYAERRPFSRCRLLHQLGDVYAARPAMLAIDLDLSPAKWLESIAPDNGPACRAGTAAAQADAACEAGCQARLYETIRASRATTATVMMLPFALLNLPGPEDSGPIVRWIREMEDAGVRIAQPRVASSYGIVLRVHPVPASLPQLACLAMARQAGWSCASRGETPREEWIDPRKYLSHIRSIDTADFQSRPGAFTPLLCHQAVFFGGGWREEDMHLTPVGLVYGVDIHAAALLTLADPLEERHRMDFAIDVAIALAFGIVIDFCWHGYFAARFSHDASRRLQAMRYVMLLALTAALVLWAAWTLSQWLLLRGIWASPLPLAIGMLVEGAVTGMITGATRASLALTNEQAPETKGLVHSLTRIPCDVVKLWKKEDDPKREQQHIARQIENLNAEYAALGRQPGAVPRKRYRNMAVMLGVYRLVLAIFVGYGLAVVFFNH